MGGERMETQLKDCSILLVEDDVDTAEDIQDHLASKAGVENVDSCTSLYQANPSLNADRYGSGIPRSM